MPELVLYGKRECPLCDEARVAIHGLKREGIGFELREVDIERDHRLHAAYLERIPVIEVDGEEVSELVCDLDAVRAALEPR